jgi:hypothetical protein
MSDDIKIHSDPTTVDVVGLDKIDFKLELPQPLETKGTNVLEIKPLEIKPLRADLGTQSGLHVDPLTTDSSISVDLKPAVVDLCLTLNIGKVPSLCIKQPYHHRVGFTFWGMEVWGFSFSGEQETVVQELHAQPKVALGGAADWSAHPPPKREHHEPPSREQGGLRIRLGD